METQTHSDTRGNAEQQAAAVKKLRAGALGVFPVRRLRALGNPQVSAHSLHLTPGEVQGTSSDEDSIGHRAQGRAGLHAVGPWDKPFHSEHKLLFQPGEVPSNHSKRF